MTWWIGNLDFRFTSEVQSDGRCVSTYMEKRLGRTDAGSFPTPQEIATAFGVVRGSPYPTDTNAICRKVDIGPGPVMTRAPFLAFIATIEWSTNAVKPDQADDDPTTSRTIWSIRPEVQGRYVIKDRNGDLIINAAGQPFDGGIPVDVRLGKVVAKRNVIAAGYDVDTVLTYSGRWNSETFLGAPAGKVQVDITADEHYEGAFHFWSETYEFKYDPQGIQPKALNAGFFQRKSGDENDPDYNVLLRIINSDVGDTNNPDDPVQEPEPLTETGILLPVDQRITPGGNFIEIDHYDSYDFNLFNLGTPGGP